MTTILMLLFAAPPLPWHICRRYCLLPHRWHSMYSDATICCLAVSMVCMQILLFAVPLLPWYASSFLIFGDCAIGKTGDDIKKILIPTLIFHMLKTIIAKRRLMDLNPFLNLWFLYKLITKAMWGDLVNSKVVLTFWTTWIIFKKGHSLSYTSLKRITKLSALNG